MKNLVTKLLHIVVRIITLFLWKGKKAAVPVIIKGSDGEPVEKTSVVKAKKKKSTPKKKKIKKKKK